MLSSVKQKNAQSKKASFGHIFKYSKGGLNLIDGGGEERSANKKLTAFSNLQTIKNFGR